LTRTEPERKKCARTGIEANPTLKGIEQNLKTNEILGTFTHFTVNDAFCYLG